MYEYLAAYVSGTLQQEDALSRTEKKTTAAEERKIIRRIY